MTDYDYNALLESREAELLQREMWEDEILGDEELFGRLAKIFARQLLNMQADLTFLDWGVERLRKEREPQWQRAWEDNR